MLSRILFGFLFLVPALASASLANDEMTKELAGRYRLEVGSGQSIQFVLRSSGAIEVLDNHDFNGLTGSISTSGSSSDWGGMNGLPVVHVVLGAGSDEDWTDYHVLLSVEQDGDERKITLITAFSAFNDGPNEYSSVNKGGMKLSKFDKDSDKFIAIK